MGHEEMNSEQLNDFFQQILTTSRAAFTELVNEHGIDKLCGFALYSDASAMTVLPSVNTKACLTRKTALDPDEPQYYRWSTAEWEYEGVRASEFEKISARLRNIHKELSDREFESHINSVYEICVKVLEELKHSGLFGSEIAVFSVSDDEDDERDIAWIKRLNSRKDAREFESWINEG